MGNYYEKEITFGYSLNDAYKKTASILEFLEWSYESNDTDFIVAVTPITAFGWGERLTISLRKKHHMTLASEYRYPFQFFDMGKNESNVDKFVEIFRKAKFPFNETDFPDEKPRSFIQRFLSGR